MKLEINKQLILEGFLIDSAKSFFNKIKNKFFSKGFKYLTEEELDTLLEFIYWHYYRNRKMSNDFLESNKTKKFKDLFDKINKNIKRMPNILYRGLYFKDEKEFNKFINFSKKYGFSSQNYLDKEYARYSSWTSRKKIAESFFDPDGDFVSNDATIGVLLEVKLKDYKDKFVFSIESLFVNPIEKKEFIKMILSKEFEKNMETIAKTKDISNINSMKLFGKMHGSVFSIKEFEYILDTIPWGREVNIIKKKIR
jgi:hypothetical protein